MNTIYRLCFLVVLMFTTSAAAQDLIPNRAEAPIKPVRDIIDQRYKLIQIESRQVNAVLTEKQKGRLHPFFQAIVAQHKLDIAPRGIHITHDLPRGVSLSHRGEMLFDAVIYADDPEGLRGYGIPVNAVVGNIATARITAEHASVLSNIAQVSYVDPGNKSYSQSNISLYETGVHYLHGGYINDTEYKGAGAIVVVFDTGVDWRHPDFLDPNDPTKTRILYLWDVTLEPEGSEKSFGDELGWSYPYGVEYTKEDIETALAGGGAIRSNDLDGHGTHVLGTIAGNGDRFKGIAPEADIIVVRGGEDVDDFWTPDIINGLVYAQKRAADLGKPVVVNLSIGDHFGAHDGNREDEIVIDQLSRDPGYVVVTSAGNYGSSFIHTSGTVEADEKDIYQPGTPAPLTTTPETKTTVSPDGSATTLTLDDGTSVSIPELPGGFELTLERDNNELSLDELIQQGTLLAMSGSVRRLTVTGSDDPTDLRPVVTIPVQEAGSINLETINVLRVGDALVDGEMVANHVAALPVFIDDAGNLSFVDFITPYGLKMTGQNAASARARTMSIGGTGGSWEGSATYVVMTFQDELNWQEQPQLVRMIPDPDVHGRRRPATDADLAERSKQPICNVVLLVHGHNEEEKEGSASPSASAPWWFNYKRLVWEILYEEVAKVENEKTVYPLDCTIFYEFIYPTYRPIFSQVPEKSVFHHETLGEALGLAIQRELVNDPRLKAMVDADMKFNAIIVAHSQGGLVARAGLRHMPGEFKENIVRFVSWGSPHHGAALYTLRYAFQAGYDVIMDNIPLPGVNITNRWVGRHLAKSALDGLALDTPGIRDLRWDASWSELMNLAILGLAWTEPAIPLFSHNLSVFNADASRELTHGGYSFITGITTKTAAREVRVNPNYPIQQLWHFVAKSTGIEQGAALNALLMYDKQQQPNDGAVPIFSQGAYNINFSAPEGVRRLDMGDIDHEEFYGAEPKAGFRYPEEIAKGFITARKTFEEAALRGPSRGCPTIEVDAAHFVGETVVTGKLDFPLYAPEHSGDGAPGRRIQRVEARAGSQEGPPIPALIFTHEDDGSFEGISDRRVEGVIWVVAILKDGSEVAALAGQVRVSIQEPRIVIYNLKDGVTEVTHEFEAVATPDSTYRFDWNFDDGNTFSEVKQPGQSSEVSHTYTGLKDGDTFYPSVKLYSEDDDLLAEDAITIRIEADDILGCVQIGNQCWMTENLDIDIGNNWYYEVWDYTQYPPEYKETLYEYGRLYDWESAIDACPEGWRLPSDDDWTQLIDYLGGEDVAGGKMKSTTGWESPNHGATNETGFSGLPGGYRNYTDFGGSFYGIGYRGYWWSSTEYGTHLKWYRSLSYSGGSVLRSLNDKQNGFSVRCLRDE